MKPIKIGQGIGAILGMVARYAYYVANWETLTPHHLVYGAIISGVGSVVGAVCGAIVEA